MPGRLPLPWHEHTCETVLIPQATAEAADETPAVQPQPPTFIFAFSTGHRVQSAQSSPAVPSPSAASIKSATLTPALSTA